MSYLPLTSTVSTGNSTTSTLAASGVFTGTSVDITQYSSVTVQVFADVASATDGLSIQQSVNGTNWDNVDTYTIPASTGKTFGVQTTANFLRVVYTNGGTIQGTFRLQTVLHATSAPTSSVRPQDTRTNDNDMQESLAYGMLYNGTTWDRWRSVGTGIGTVALPDSTNTFSIAANATSGGTVTTNGGAGTLLVNVTGTFVATLQIQVSGDGTNYVNVTGSNAITNLATGAYVASGNITGTGIYQVDVGGIQSARVITTAYTSGTVTGTTRLSTGVSMVGIEGNPVLGGGSNTIGSLNNVATIGTSLTPGTSAAHLGKAEDAVAASGDTGVMALAVRRDTPITSESAAGDYGEIGKSGQGALWTTPTPSVGGGWSFIKYNAQTTTVQTVKGTAATFGGYFIYNPNSAVMYVQVFNAATATTITLGTTAPDLTFPIPATAGANLEIANGLLMTNGIKLACTTTATGSTAPTTGLDLNIWYK